MKVVFNTAEFECSHGRKPRGTGGWMFEITGPKEWCYLPRVIRVYPGTLTEAKAEVRAGLKERVKLGIIKSGTYLVTVLP